MSFVKYDAKIDLRIGRQYKEILERLSKSSKRPKSEIARNILERSLARLAKKLDSNPASLQDQNEF
jgi:predicted DNA-binding protein